MSSVISLVLPVGYGVVVLEGVLMCLQCFHEGMTVFKVRERIFGKAFGAKHFPSVQQDMQHGYPDNGGGRLSDKLSDEDFFALNNANRVHYNYVEQLPIAITLTMVSGLNYPRLTAVAAGAYIVGRYLYGTGYRKRGPAGRYTGVPLVDLALAVLLGGSLLSTWMIGGGLEGWQRGVKAFIGQ